MTIILETLTKRTKLILSLRKFILTQTFHIMKKIILIAAMALGFVVTAVAGNPVDKATGALEKTFGGKVRSVGIRNTEISYQHSFDADFVQVDLGFLPGMIINGHPLNSHSLNIAATYNFMLLQPQWTDRGEWGIYAGPGVALGFDMGFSAKTAGVNIAVAGLVGLEYRFWFPLQLSIEWRPQLGVHIGDWGNGFCHPLHCSLYPALGIRYAF